MEGPHVYVPCHFLHVDGHIDPSLVIVLAKLCCVLCVVWASQGVGTMLICDWCPKG
jgi:hypothetical protein